MPTRALLDLIRIRIQQIRKAVPLLLILALQAFSTRKEVCLMIGSSSNLKRLSPVCQ
jgi:hypothetical protein